MPERAARTSAMTVVLASVVSVMCVILAMVLFVKSVRDEDKEQARQLVELRSDQQVEVCKQDNIETTRTRKFKHEQVSTFARLFFEATPAEIQEIENGNGMALYDDFIADAFPFRDCSRECVAAFYDHTIPDCPAPKLERP